MPLEGHKFYFITNIKICLKGEIKEKAILCVREKSEELRRLTKK